MNNSITEIKKKKSMLGKAFIPVLISFLLLLIALGVGFGRSLGWFAANKNVEANGMGVRIEGAPFTIQTRNSSGFYKDKWDRLGSTALEWQVSSTHNLDNHENDLDPNEEDPGLEPGDSGKLEFRVNPNESDTITVDCVLDFRIYLETPVFDHLGEPVYDENNNQATEINEITDEELLGFIKSHIMLFTNYDESTGKYSGLIGTDENLRRVLADKTYTKNGTDYTVIYWKWPMHLEELTSNEESKLLFDPAERTNVINYIAANRTGFFMDCTYTEQQVKSDLNALASAYDNSIYNRYNMRFDNADLDIGHNISYVMLSMTVEQ